MAHSYAEAFRGNFLGNSPDWYKLTIIGFLVVNPILVMIDPFIAGWALVLEFIFTLAMALRCYPLQPGGLLAIEAVVIGMTTLPAVSPGEPVCNLGRLPDETDPAEYFHLQRRFADEEINLDGIRRYCANRMERLRALAERSSTGR